MRRKRFIQLCVRSTTQRRALKPASCLMACASSPRARICAVKPNSFTISRTSSKSYPLSRHSPCGVYAVGSGCSAGMDCNVPRTSFMSCRLAPSMAIPTGMPLASVSRLRLTPCLPRSVGFASVFLNQPMGPSSSPHPSKPRTSRCRRFHRIAADPHAKWP